MIFKWILFGTFFASFTDKDYDGVYNHLYEWKDSSHVMHHVAFRHEKIIKPENVKSMVVECNGMDGRASNRTNSWVTYNAYFCNAMEITMLDNTKINVEEPANSEPLSLEEQAKVNSIKKKKEAEERLKTNKKVLKNYRIK